MKVRVILRIIQLPIYKILLSKDKCKLIRQSNKIQNNKLNKIIQIINT